MSKIAKIKFKKIVVRGTKMYEVVSIEGVQTKEELPDEYTKNYHKDYFFKNEKGTVGFSHTYAGFNIGDVFTENRYENTVAFMKKCGIRLTEINKKLKLLEHSGEFTVEI